MSKARPFVGIMLFCFSAYLGATEEPQCRCSLNNSDQEANHIKALENYEEAWRRNFDERWSEADEASACAGYLDHGSAHWNLENLAGY